MDTYSIHIYGRNRTPWNLRRLATKVDLTFSAEIQIPSLHMPYKGLRLSLITRFQAGTSYAPISIYWSAPSPPPQFMICKYGRQVQYRDQPLVRRSDFNWIHQKKTTSGPHVHMAILSNPSDTTGQPRRIYDPPYSYIFRWRTALPPVCIPETFSPRPPDTSYFGYGKPLRHSTGSNAGGKSGPVGLEVTRGWWSTSWAWMCKLLSSLGCTYSYRSKYCRNGAYDIYQPRDGPVWMPG